MNRSVIKKLKYHRMKPEEKFLCDIFDGLIITINNVIADKSVDDVWFDYKKDDIILVEYRIKTGSFYCNYDKIWSVFIFEFKYTSQQTTDFIKQWSENYFNITNINPMQI
jgi:hypothetical protein